MYLSDIFLEMVSFFLFFGKVSYDVFSGWNSFLWGSFMGESILFFYEDGFNFFDKKVCFVLSDWVEFVVFFEEYDLYINNGWMFEYFYEGNMINKLKGIQFKVFDVFVEVLLEFAVE